MPAEPMISEAFARTAAIVLITVAFIAYGGTFLLRVLQGGFPATSLQKSFFRAGHAHAGMLVTLGLVVGLIVDLAGVTGIPAAMASGVLLATIFIPAGFFLSVASRGAERPNGLIALLWVGVAMLLVGVVGAAVGLLGV